MWIESEPADLLMMRYFLCFPKGEPDPEDRHVRQLLADAKLAPKRRSLETRHGIDCEVLQYGQCYLGRALGVIAAMRDQGVVAGSLAQALREDEAWMPLAAGRPLPALNDAAWLAAGAALEERVVAQNPEQPGSFLVDADALKNALERAFATLEQQQEEETHAAQS